MTGETNNNKDKANDLPKEQENSAAPVQPGLNAELESKKVSGDEAKSTTEAAAKNRVKPNKEVKKGSAAFKIFLGLVLVLFLVLAISGYFAWQQWQFQQQRIEALETQAATQNSQVKKLIAKQEQQSGSQLTLLDKLKLDQKILQQRLDSHSQRLKALAGTSRDDWLLAEARYLLRLASQRLLVERSTEGPIALLESADAVLQSVDDMEIQAVRDAITSDLIALKLAKTVDRQGIYSKLLALKVQVQTLPAIPMKADSIVEASLASQEIAVTDTRESSWYEHIWLSIKGAFGGIKDFVQVRHFDQAPELLLSEQHQAQLLANLLLMFEQAQYALLHEEETIYIASLQQALDWWQAHFVQYQEFEVINSELKQLQQIKIVQSLPSINNSIRRLSDYIERFHQLDKLPAAEQNSSSIEPLTQVEEMVQ